MSKVLVVEDHEDIREVIRITLELDDFEMQEAENGDLGLDAARRWKPDLVLMDVMMPGRLDGLQACQAIKRDPALKKTRVILLSARGQAQDKAAGRSAGADAYLVKPYSPMELLSTIRKVLS